MLLSIVASLGKFVDEGMHFLVDVVGHIEVQQTSLDRNKFDLTLGVGTLKHGPAR